jgi:hypothetical protein
MLRHVMSEEVSISVTSVNFYETAGGNIVEDQDGRHFVPYGVRKSACYRGNPVSTLQSYYTHTVYRPTKYSIRYVWTKFEYGNLHKQPGISTIPQYSAGNG